MVPYVVHSNHVAPQPTFRYSDWITLTGAGACGDAVYVTARTGAAYLKADRQQGEEGSPAAPTDTPFLPVLWRKTF